MQSKQFINKPLIKLLAIQSITEFHLPFSFLILLTLFISTLLFLKTASNKFKSVPKSSPTSRLPPGPWKLRFIGNLHNLVGSLPHRALRGLSSKHGPLMHLQLGELSTVVVSSPEAAKQVMKTHDIDFASRPSILVAEIIAYGSTSITMAPYGDYWRQLRKICTLELLSAKRVQSFRGIRERVFSELIRSIDSNDGTAINLTEKLYSSTYSVTTRVALGKKTAKEQEMFLSLLKEILELSSGFDAGDLYPSNKLFQMVGGMRTRLERVHRKIDGILDDIIKQHKEDINWDQDDDGKQEDLVDVLLKFQDDAFELPLTTDNIKAVLLDVLGAGNETSATTMDWAMAEMLKNPQVLHKAQEEIRHVFYPKGYIDESQIQQLNYLKSIIKETLRLHTPLPLLLPRKCTKNCEINGYDIPTDTKIIVNAWAINRDPTYWKDAEFFQPERFLENDRIAFRGNNFEYIPFGARRRICPGMSFGLANVELPLAMFLYHFDWKLPDGMKPEEMDMAEGFGVTTRRKTDLFVVPFTKRPLHR